MLIVQPYYLFWQESFLRLLAMTYFLAFASLYVQIPGLIGAKGVMPAKLVLDWVRRSAGNYPYFQFPTLFWLGSSNAALKGAAIAGMTASLLTILGAPAAPLLAVTWVIYLSFRNVGSDFLCFQWDALLLEMGFIAIFFAIQSPPPPMLVYVLWFLNFRFIFASGIMKFVWGSDEWRDLSAMCCHYETQPLPNKAAYYVHQLPAWMGKATVVAIYLWEIVLPFFIFGPLWMRVVVCVLLILLQVNIFLTGNFAFFNILSAVLCIPMVMDLNPGMLFSGLEASPVVPSNLWVNGALSLVGCVLMVMNVAEFGINVIRHPRIVKILYPFTLAKYLAPYYIVNGYGLFSHMTSKRYEVVVEGSNDEKTWQAYEFKWKPGDLAKAPCQVAPHQPRLDWQMWFLPFNRYQHNSWLTNFMSRLLEGEPDVTGLLHTNPFAGAPPKYVRSVVYLYHFTDLKTKRETGCWWKREFAGVFSPTLSLKK